MTKEEVKWVQPGLYRVYLKNGCTFMAAIGINKHGGRWLAATQWNGAFGMDADGQEFWENIDKVKKL
jgi:hypothetical protein